MKRIILAAALAVGAITVGATASQAGGPEKIDVCHVNGTGDYNLISISENAYDTHLDHGDAAIGSSAAPGIVFGSDCSEEEVPAGLVITTSVVCDQPAADTFSYSTSATAAAGWGVSVAGGSGTESVNEESAAVAGVVTLTSPYGTVSTVDFTDNALRPEGCEAASETVRARAYIDHDGDGAYTDADTLIAEAIQQGDGSFIVNTDAYASGTGNIASVDGRQREFLIKTRSLGASALKQDLPTQFSLEVAALGSVPQTWVWAKTTPGGPGGVTETYLEQGNYQNQLISYTSLWRDNHTPGYTRDLACGEGTQSNPSFIFQCKNNFDGGFGDDKFINVDLFPAS